MSHTLLVQWTRRSAVAGALGLLASLGAAGAAVAQSNIAFSTTRDGVLIGNAEIYVMRSDGAEETRLTFDTDANLASDVEPTWSPDATRLAFRTGRSQAPAVVAGTFDGRDEVLADTNSPLTPEDWSPDGSLIAYTNSTRNTGADLWLLPLEKPRKPRVLLQTPANEWDAKFSPDSAWIAFTSNELGAPDVYVMRVDGSAKTRISVDGGSSPRWRRDGKELYYLGADNRTLTAVSVEIGAGFKAGQSTRLFTMRSDAASRVGLRYAGYDATPDGQRFLFSVATAQPTTSRLTIVQNWAAALHR